MDQLSESRVSKEREREKREGELAVQSPADCRSKQ